MTFQKLVQLTHSHSDRAIRAAEAQLERRFIFARRDVVVWPLHNLFLATTALIARKRYGDMTVRALLAGVEAERLAGDLVKGQRASAPAFPIEKRVLDGETALDGLRLACEDLTTQLVTRRLIRPRGNDNEQTIYQWISVAFGAVDSDEAGEADGTIESVENLPNILFGMVNGYADSCDLLFATNLVACTHDV